jgi:hypothetical protein
VHKFGKLDRTRCRREFEQRFNAQRMARDYVAVYRELLGLPVDDDTTDKLDPGMTNAA